MIIKQIFKGKIFPVSQDKKPQVRYKQNWQHWEGDEDHILLAGLNLTKCDMLVVDFDTYKEDFKRSKEAQAFYRAVKAKALFMQKTQSGGEHYFFKQPEGKKIKNSSPFPGVDIKGIGGYICLYQAFFDPARDCIETFKKFHSLLPVFDFKDYNKITGEALSNGEFKNQELVIKSEPISPGRTTSKIPPQKITEPGPGRNNKANAQNMFRAGQAGSVEQAKEHIKKLIQNNQGRPDFDLDAHLKDALSVFKKSFIPQQESPAVTPRNRARKSKAETENKDIYKTVPFTKIVEKQPTALYADFLLENEFNFIYGANKIGKTQGILFLLSKALKKEDKCGILSTENDPQMMLKRLLNFMEWEDKFTHINDKLVKTFTMKEAKSGIDKIKVFLKRLRLLLTENKLKVLLIDPLPRFFDWNQESPACLMLDGLREVCKEFSTTILGIRNEGKCQTYETSAMYKGSSVIGDLSRQVVRAIKVHPRSALAKEKEKDEDGNDVDKNEGKKLLVLYTELSSLFKQSAYLFRLEVDHKKRLSYPILVKEMDDPIETVKYLCEAKSGQSLGIKIANFVRDKGTVTLDDLYEEFEFQYEKDNIRKTADRHCDSIKEAGKTKIYIPYQPLPHKK